MGIGAAAIAQKFPFQKCSDEAEVLQPTRAVGKQLPIGGSRELCTVSIFLRTSTFGSRNSGVVWTGPSQ
jgi:hypothetical protein